jgi:hypothetical protein
VTDRRSRTRAGIDVTPPGKNNTATIKSTAYTAYESTTGALSGIPLMVANRLSA